MKRCGYTKIDGLQAVVLLLLIIPEIIFYKYYRYDLAPKWAVSHIEHFGPVYLSMFVFVIGLVYMLFMTYKKKYILSILSILLIVWSIAMLIVDTSCPVCGIDI